MYRSGDHFGFVDMFSGIRRNGTAQASEDCQLYKIQKNQIEDILSDYTSTKKKLINEALEDNKTLTEKAHGSQKEPNLRLELAIEDCTSNIKNLSNLLR